MDWNEGRLSTPTLEIEGRIVTEPSDEELAEILGLMLDDSQDVDIADPDDKR